jgi:hypothetical protein
VLDASKPITPEALDAVVSSIASDVLAELREQLDADQDLSAEERAAILVVATPTCEEKVRRVILCGVLHLTDPEWLS